jgi:endonuclease/exonuclease/phosphatase family metal-dependent hydrolase
LRRGGAVRLEEVGAVEEGRELFARKLLAGQEVTRHPGIVFRALSWNLFHGRDFPPDPALLTWRSRLLRITEANATHAQVNRVLLREFTAILAREQWDIALLQEAPPRWLEPLCGSLGANGALALTSRNQAGALRARLADLNPDLIASNEGGSNQILVRPPWRIAATRRLTIARLPERRRLLWARLERDGAPPLAVANMHTSAKRPRRAAQELLRAAAWAGDERLLLGGDLNLRPAEDPETFELLERRFGLSQPTAPGAIDHLLARGLELVEPPELLQPERREVELPDGLRLRLSDHAIAAASFAMA